MTDAYGDLAALVGPSGVEFIADTLAGDAESAKQLYHSIPDRGQAARLVRALWRIGPVDSFRAVLERAWHHEHGALFNVFSDYREIATAFFDAKFPTDHLAEKFDVYRGCALSESDEFPQDEGISWTLNRDLACWFALRYNFAAWEPVVWRRTVNRNNCAAHITCRGEDEIILYPGHALGAVDGTPDEWRVRAEAWLDKLECRQRQEPEGRKNGLP